jgi:hypothetical protein
MCGIGQWIARTLSLHVWKMDWCSVSIGVSACICMCVEAGNGVSHSTPTDTALVLTGYGNVYGAGNPVVASVSATWPGWMIARDIAVLPSGTGGYVLEGYGGLHPFGVASNGLPPGATGSAYWSGWDIARAVAMLPSGTGGYVLDGYGGLHPFTVGGNPMPPAARTTGY